MSPESTKSLPQQYFSLFQDQVDACQISDPLKHAERRKEINQQIRTCLHELKTIQETDDPEIWYALGHAAMFYDKDRTKSTEWYQRAADAGHTKAITKMGNQLRQSSDDTDRQKSHDWLKKASEQGDHYAMLSMGCAYRDGQGVEKDIALAKEWFLRAHQAGELTASEQLADLHLNHRHSPAEALPYYLQSYEQGLSCDQELAEIYNTRGSGVYDPTKAKEHYEILLKRGKKSPPKVMLELAKLHASGQVSENGVTHAKKWCYQIITQCPKSMTVRKKAERLLDNLSETLF